MSYVSFLIKIIGELYYFHLIGGKTGAEKATEFSQGCMNSLEETEVFSDFKACVLPPPPSSASHYNSVPFKGEEGPGQYDFSVRCVTDTVLGALHQ